MALRKRSKRSTVSQKDRETEQFNCISAVLTPPFKCLGYKPSRQQFCATMESESVINDAMTLYEDEYIEIVSLLPFELKQLIIALSLRNIPLLKYYVYFEDVLKLCSTYTEFQITHQEEEIDNFDMSGLQAYQYESAVQDRLIVDSVCLNEPFAIDLTYLNLYTDFLNTISISKITIGGKFVSTTESEYEEGSLLVRSLCHQAREIALTRLERSEVIPDEYKKTTEIIELTEDAMEDVSDGNFPILKKVTVFIEDDFRSFDELEAMKPYVSTKINLVFSGNARFFDIPVVRRALYKGGYEFKIEELTGPINDQTFFNYCHYNVERMYIEDSETFAYLHLFRPNSAHIQLSEIENNKYGNDIIKELEFNVESIRDSDFSNYVALKKLTLITNSIDLKSFNSFPETITEMDLSLTLTGATSLSLAKLPKDLENLTFRSQPNLKQISFENSKQLKSLSFSNPPESITAKDGVWSTLPSSLASVRLSFVPENKVGEDLDWFGMRINDQIEELEISILATRKMLVCVNDSEKSASSFERLKKEFNLPTCVISNVSNKVLIKDSGCEIIVACPEEEEKNLFTRSSFAVPFRKMGSKYGLRLFSSVK